jgi:16S rRNA (cytidine1402-2'-O)-methyltransferase
MAEDRTGTFGGPDTGTLFVVATPIGTLEDISLRALRILKQADLIAAESREHTLKLCRHFDIRTRISSYNQNNRALKEPQLLERLDSGMDIALVTNAGTPGISDPGLPLVKTALEKGIRVSVVPGPCAAVAALSMSGLRTDGFLFAGFLSPRSGRRRKELETVANETRTLVFYETARRLKGMIKDLQTVLGDRQAAVAREMTKIHEQVLHGKLSGLAEQVDIQGVRGEMTVLVEGMRPDGSPQKTLDRELEGRIQELISKGDRTLGDIARKLSLEHGASYRHIYKACLSVKATLEHD